MLLKVICRVNKVPIKIPALFFIEIEKIIKKKSQKHKISQIGKEILSKKNNAGVIPASKFMKHNPHLLEKWVCATAD